MKISRKLHLWIGLLFAPSIIFFALSGALQMFGLHEASGGDPAPTWISKLAEIHKIQSIDTMPTRTPRAAAAAAPTAPTAAAALAAPSAAAHAASPRAAEPLHVVAPPPRAQPHRSIPLLVWFSALAVGLVASTGFGIYMAFAYKRDRAVVIGLLVAGVVLPVVFALL